MTVLQVPVERVDAISAQARQVHVGRLLLTFVAAVLMGVGRCVGWLVNAVVWSAVAVREGYRDARAPRSRAGVG